MKKPLKHSLFALVLLVFCALCAFPAHAADYSTVINQMDYTMTVNENHSYDINVKETVTFRGYQHGIYRAFAQSGTFYREVDGQQNASAYHAVISDVRVESGQPYSVSRDGEAYIIKIGDPNYVVSGKQTYEYSFNWDPGNDGIDSFDDVYQNILSQYMQNPIEKLNVTIHMPKAFNADNVNFYSGSYGATTDENLNVQVSGNTIKATNIEPIVPGTVLTVNIRLPQGYFTGMNTGLGKMPLYYGAALIALLLGTGAYFIWGRGKKPVTPVMFYPPDGFDPAQVGYVVDQKISTDIAAPLLIFFADQGWLTIENLSANANRYQLHKVRDIPTDRPAFEQTYFNALFARSDDPEISDLSRGQRFYQALLLTTEQVKDWFTGARRIQADSIMMSKLVNVLLILITCGTFAYAATYVLFRQFDSFAFLLAFVLTAIGPLITSVGNKAFGFVITVMLTAMTAFMLLHWYMALPVLAVSLLLSYFAHTSDRRTPVGNKWYGECLGFKHFIKTAELDRIEKLVEDNPQYYYNILPYANVLGLTDKWAEHFKSLSLAPPVWYVDPYFQPNLFQTMMFYNYFNAMTNRYISTINAQQIQSLARMGSGGFGGGGFGGGGFGGGGGGGMGGGSW